MTEAGSSALPRWAAGLTAELDAADQRAQRLASGLTAEQLNWQPSPGAWSIGQCLDHLCVAAEVYLPPITTALEQGHGPATEEITPGWFSRWFLRSYIEEAAPQKKRGPAPKKIVPNARVELSVLDRFERGNQAVRELIRKAATFDVNRIRFKNPFISGLRFTVGTGLLIICRHEGRHLLQAERVKTAAGFPT